MGPELKNEEKIESTSKKVRSRKRKYIDGVKVVGEVGWCERREGSDRDVLGPRNGIF